MYPIHKVYRQFFRYNSMVTLYNDSIHCNLTGRLDKTKPNRINGKLILLSNNCPVLYIHVKRPSNRVYLFYNTDCYEEIMNRIYFNNNIKTKYKNE